MRFHPVLHGNGEGQSNHRREVDIAAVIREGAAQERPPGDSEGIPGVRFRYGGRLHCAVQLQEQQ